MQRNSSDVQICRYFKDWKKGLNYIKPFYFQLLTKESAGIPHTRPETPRSVTHTHDEDYSDEESDPNNKNEETDENENA